MIILHWPRPIFAHTENFEVHMTENGFSPNLLTISQGDTVNFINDGTKPLWPASDIHPTHQVFPDFDPKKEIAPGQTWSFQFTKAGSWQMHDHLFPQNLGKIIVKKNLEYKNIEKKIIEPTTKEKINSKIEEIKISILQKYYSIFPDQLNNVLANISIHKIAAGQDDKQMAYYLKLLGSKKVMDKLISDSGGGSVVDCHQEAHRLGRVAFKLFGANVFRQGSFDCHSGFIHGAMESFLQEKGTENIAKNIDNLCSIFKTSFGNFECLHGVGHGVMAYVNYDLLEAIKTCKHLSTSFEQSSCYGGVFMENVVTAQGNGASENHSTKWVSNDPHFPCNAVPSDNNVQVQCYLMQTSRMLDIGGYNFDFVTENCLTAPKNMIDTCFQSEGRDAAGHSLRNPEKIITICSKVPTQYYSNCITGALNVIIEFWADKMDDKPHKLCQLIQDGGAKNSCYSVLSSRLEGIYGTDKKKTSQSCEYFEPRFKSSCLSENNL